MKKNPLSSRRADSALFFNFSSGLSGFMLVLGALVINIALQGPRFFSTNNITSLLSSNLPLILAALSQMVIMLSGGIDISTGNTMALVNGTFIVLFNTLGFTVFQSAVISLLAGTAVGLANGLIIAYLHISPLLATFAMSVLVRGISLLVLPKPGGTIPPFIYQTYGGVFLVLPTALWIILVSAFLIILLSRFRFSRSVIAIGANERNAYISGINVERVKVLSYALGGLIAAFAGLCLTALTASGDVRVGETFALQSIAAVIIGGRLNSGKWTNNVSGAICGALFLAVVNNIVFFAFIIIMRNNPSLQISTFYQQLLSNFIIVFGLASAVLTNKKRLYRTRQRGGKNC